MITKELINEYLENNPTQMEFFLTNGISVSVNEPDSDTLIVADDFVKVIRVMASGCSRESYIPLSTITFMNIVADCPKIGDE